MAVTFGNLVNYISGGRVSAPITRPIDTSFKKASYAAIPYERAPQQGDTVKTVDANGNPLLAGYQPAGRVFDSNKWLGL